MAEDGVPIAYTALEKGVPVVTRSGRRFGVVDRVVGEPEQDIFHGIVVDTSNRLRFVDRDHVERMTTARVVCALDDDDVATLPPASAEAPEERRARSGVRTRLADGPPVLIVRCSRGALFQTVWIPMFSLKAVRLGRRRLQWCPVHQRREIVQPVDPATLTGAELAQAARYPADPIP